MLMINQCKINIKKNKHSRLQQARQKLISELYKIEEEMADLFTEISILERLNVLKELSELSQDIGLYDKK